MPSNQGCGSGSGSADFGLFGWKWLRGTASASASCFRFQEGILRLSLEKMTVIIFEIVGKNIFGLNLEGSFENHICRFSLKNFQPVMFHFIDNIWKSPEAWKRKRKQSSDFPGSGSGSKTAPLPHHCFNFLDIASKYFHGSRGKKQKQKGLLSTASSQKASSLCFCFCF
jgi:hypothetical protein